MDSVLTTSENSRLDHRRGNGYPTLDSMNCKVSSRKKGERSTRKCQRKVVKHETGLF